MSGSRRRFLARLASSLIVPIATRSWASELDRTSWQTDFARAQRIRVAQQRPLLVFVTTDGCPYCHKMMRKTYTEAGIAAEAAETFLLTVVNSSQQADVAKQLGVRIYPTTYLIDADNRLIDRIEGYVPADQFRKRLAVASRRLASRATDALPR